MLSSLGMPDFLTFSKQLGVSFNNSNLLIEALTHRSYLNEHRDYAGSHNERLEFLGDAVLELAATDFLFKKFPAKPEGELTSYRAALVNTVSLAESAQALGINDYLLLSKGEAKDTGRARDVILGVIVLRVFRKPGVGQDLVELQEGFASLAVSNGRVYALGNAEDRDTVFCLAADTGAVLWRHSYPCELQPLSYEGGPGATPAVA